MELDVIDLPSAVTLLRIRVPDLAEDVAQEIAQEFGRLLLALEQAAAYLDKSGMPPQAYLGLLRRRAEELFARGQVSGRHETIATLRDIAAAGELGFNEVIGTLVDYSPAKRAMSTRSWPSSAGLTANLGTGASSNFATRTVTRCGSADWRADVWRNQEVRCGAVTFPERSGRMVGSWGGHSWQACRRRAAAG
jgi:hypothetical protein